METYLKDFTFLTKAKEKELRECESRTCFNVYYPFDIFPPKGLHHVTFDPVTIFYGGNGSGKSTALNIIATRLNLLCEIPFKPTHFFDWYVNCTEYNHQWSEAWKCIPAESRILTSEDVFDKTLTIRGRNREIDRQRDLVARKWWNCRFEGERSQLTSIHGPEYDL
jgi:predicted ATPase